MVIYRVADLIWNPEVNFTVVSLECPEGGPSAFPVRNFF